MCFNDNHVVCPRIGVSGCRTKNWPVYANASVRPTLSGPGARYAASTSLSTCSLAKIEHISSPHCRVGPGSVNQIKMERYRQHLGQALPNTPPSQVFFLSVFKTRWQCPRLFVHPNMLWHLVWYQLRPFYCNSEQVHSESTKKMESLIQWQHVLSDTVQPLLCFLYEAPVVLVVCVRSSEMFV